MQIWNIFGAFSQATSYKVYKKEMTWYWVQADKVKQQEKSHERTDICQLTGKSFIGHNLVIFQYTYNQNENKLFQEIMKFHKI